MRVHAALTSAIIGMAHGLKLSVVAEGVELPTQFDFLRERGCDVIQGYLVGRPTSRENMPEFIRGRQSMMQAATRQPTKVVAKAH